MSAPTIHNLAYVEQLYASYCLDPQSVTAEWREYFGATGDEVRNGKAKLGPSFHPRTAFNPVAAVAPAREEFQLDPRAASVRDRLNELIRDFRLRGHMIAEVDPLGAPRPCPPELKLAHYGFTESELDLLSNCATLAWDTPLTIREIYDRLRDTYCRSIGVQFMHIDNPTERRWLQRRMESSMNRLELTPEEQRRILTRLTDAVVFEEFIRKKFVGAKSFSLEGGESLIPLLDLAIEKAADQGVGDIVIGMAHRGRLNVLSNIIGKNPCEIFREFADADPELWVGRGDVKYHLGHSGDWTTSSGRNVHLSLCFNPSHLEFVNPVVLGRVRARQDRRGDRDRREVLGLLIHGDAAFAGEGIVQETLNLSELPGYRVGGVLHVVINNQIGFTTSPAEGRSTMYATDVARMLRAPIFHVNGEDPEAVAQVVRLALDFRHEFQRDVFIDMYGYRRWGHNETDEPAFTQPLLYHAIEQRPSVREGYLEHLLKLNDITAKEAEEIAHARREKLEQELIVARGNECAPETERSGVWRDYCGGVEPHDEPDTGVETGRLAELLRKLSEVPPAFRPHPKLERMMKVRLQMADGGHPLDWAAAEALAFATLASEGVRLRLSGQDAGRGTFSHRHAILHDYHAGYPVVPIARLAPDQTLVEILNSPLSEAGVLGFEYGYSLDCPSGLVLWEAQFGDFVNAAQVILDQFISSAEDKWRRLSSLVLLLPHGFEGLGPEHSSARLERFLSLAAEDNLQIVQPTTPAQYFHCLRRQVLRKWHKPLVVLTPKSLLRHSQAVSTLEDCARGRFQRVLPDPERMETAQRVLLCTGKIFYDLAAYREEQDDNDTKIVRVEQLYPLRPELLETALALCPVGTPVFWVQEEPENMGAWRYWRGRFGDTMFGRYPLRLVSRPESASPATGSAGAHKLEQAALIQRAFGEQKPNGALRATVTKAPSRPKAHPA